MDPKFNAMMNPEFLNEAVLNSAVQNVCDANWSFASTELEMSISDQDLSKLPKRQEILDLLGQPLENFDQENAWVYEFRLISDSKEPSTARFAVWFDESGEMPIRMESRYSRYRTRVDFIEKKMFMKVKI